MIKKVLAIFATIIMIGTIFTSVVYAGTNPPPLPILGHQKASFTEVNTVEVWHDETKILNESLIISNGGQLILRNVDLIMNSTYDNELVIRVEKWGSLHIFEGSTITANNPNLHYRF
ncbi:hypothetical protein KA005_00500 [bacterium]|nr:hypothetical protein [bacterium]